MKDSTKVIVKYTALGAAIGISIVPARMLYDTLAPISYPIGGAIAGITGAAIDNTVSYPTGIALGVSLRVITMPAAPFNFLVAPIVLPLIGTIGGALKGIIEADKLKKGE